MSGIVPIRLWPNDSDFWSEDLELGLEPLSCPLAGLDHVPSHLYPQHLICQGDHSVPFPRTGKENRTHVSSVSELMSIFLGVMKLPEFKNNEMA